MLELRACLGQFLFTVIFEGLKSLKPLFIVVGDFPHHFCISGNKLFLFSLQISLDLSQLGDLLLKEEALLVTEGLSFVMLRSLAQKGLLCFHQSNFSVLQRGLDAGNLLLKCLHILSHQSPLSV